MPKNINDEKNLSGHLSQKEGAQNLHPETLMMGYGYSPALSEGSVKPPIFLTSTFVFKNAEEGREFFDVVAGRKSTPAGGAGLVYARFNQPNNQIIEERLAIYEEGEAGLVFSSGMAAIFTALFAYARPGDVILHSQPLYGGTETLLGRNLAAWGVQAEGFRNGLDLQEMQHAAQKAMEKGRVSVIFIETPSNPLNTQCDFSRISDLVSFIEKAQGVRPIVMCDNTLLGPVFQKPLTHGIDIVLYSVTKYIGGHSDLVAGAVIGNAKILQPIRLLRGAIGTQLDPHSAWMIGRSLETLALRMEAANRNAEKIIEFLNTHPAIEKIYALNQHAADSEDYKVFKRQSTGIGSTFSIVIKGGEKEAFAVLNRLKLFKLAVSLGGTESLVTHPASTTHSGVPRDVREATGVSEGLIRLSVGIENADNLIEDLKKALSILVK